MQPKASLYANYWFIADLISAGVDFVMEQHGSRITDFRRGQRLGTRDHLVDWVKPADVPAWMSREQYRAYPPLIRLREARVGHRVLVTSFLAPRAVPKAEPDAIYRQRWHIELDLRSIKTTLGLDILRCRSADMIEKEFWVHLLAYNLIRLLMAQAAATHGTHHVRSASSTRCSCSASSSCAICAALMRRHSRCCSV